MVFSIDSQSSIEQMVYVCVKVAIETIVDCYSSQNSSPSLHSQSVRGSELLLDTCTFVRDLSPNVMHIQSCEFLVIVYHYCTNKLNDHGMCIGCGN